MFHEPDPTPSHAGVLAFGGGIVVALIGIALHGTMVGALIVVIGMVAFVLGAWDYFLGFPCAKCKRRKHMGLIGPDMMYGFQRGFHWCGKCYEGNEYEFFLADGHPPERIAHLKKRA